MPILAEDLRHVVAPAQARSRTDDVVRAVVVAIAYVIAARFGFTLAFATAQVTAVWPPTGLALVALLLFGARVTPGVFVGALVSNALRNEPVYTAAGIAVGNTLAPLAGYLLLTRVTSFNLALRRVRDVLGLVFLAAFAGMMVSATNGVAQLAWAGIVPWSSFPSVWWVWWIGDAMGVLLVAPVLLAWYASPLPPWRGWRLAELALLGVSLAVVSVLTLSTARDLQYFTFPFIIWTALRFRQRETATAVLMVCGIAVWEAINGRGPFATGTLDERLILLELFMAVVALTGLVLGAVSAERRSAESALVEAHGALERRVQERTAELAAANGILTSTNDTLIRRTEELATKNEEVEAFAYIVSHDLRAPLVNLQGFSRELALSCTDLTNALATPDVPAAVQERVKPILDDAIPTAMRFISASTVKFQRLIDALLVLSRSGRQELRIEQVDVDALVRGTLDTLQITVAKAGATVTIAPLPPAAGDVTALGQVFSNLMANALAYALPGRPAHIDIGGVVEQDKVRYWVRDNGAGIPPSAMRRLFQVFQRFHPQLGPGEGMGLAIVKRIVERHGGKIWAESGDGVGTTFFLTLPVHAPERDGP